MNAHAHWTARIEADAFVVEWEPRLAGIPTGERLTERVPFRLVGRVEERDARWLRPRCLRVTLVAGQVLDFPVPAACHDAADVFVASLLAALPDTVVRA